MFKTVTFLSTLCVGTPESKLADGVIIYITR